MTSQTPEAVAEGLSEAQHYALGLLAEEMGEALQVIGKLLRFGDDPGPACAPYFGRTAREMLPTELGDVVAAIDYAILAGLAPSGEVTKRAEAKGARLLNPNSTDAHGKRLAPAVRAHLEQKP